MSNTSSGSRSQDIDEKAGHVVRSLYSVLLAGIRGFAGNREAGSESESSSGSAQDVERRKVGRTKSTNGVRVRRTGNKRSRIGSTDTRRVRSLDIVEQTMAIANGHHQFRGRCYWCHCEWGVAPVLLCHPEFERKK